MGGLCLLIGLFVRPAAAFLILTMFVICVYHLGNSGTLMMARAHAVELGIGYTALLFMGAGKFSVDRKFGLDAWIARRPG